MKTCDNTSNYPPLSCIYSSWFWFSRLLHTLRPSYWTHTHKPLQSQLYLVLVSHVASSPHLFDHQVPELSLCFQIGLERLLPAPNTQLQAGDSQEKEGSWGHLHLLKGNKTRSRSLFQDQHPLNDPGYLTAYFAFFSHNWLKDHPAGHPTFIFPFVSPLNLGTVPPPRILVARQSAGRAVVESWRSSPRHDSSWRMRTA